MEEAATSNIPATDIVPPPSVVSEGLVIVQSLMKGDISALKSDLLLKLAVSGISVLLMIIVTYFVAKFVSRFVSSAICKRIDETLGKFVGQLAFYAIMLTVGISILQSNDINVTSFAAILAAAGFAIGLAFQGTLSNFAAGILLLVFRPFKVGDMIQAGGVLGKVNEIDLFTTKLDTPDNRRLILPNSSISGATIENISFHAHRRVDVVVGVAYSANVEETRSVLMAVVESMADKMIVGDNRGYQVILSALNASSVDWTIRFWTASSDFFAVRESLTSRIKTSLDDAGIKIPFPQMELHISKDRVQSLADSRISEESAPPAGHLTPSDGERPRRIRPRVRGEGTPF